MFIKPPEPEEINYDLLATKTALQRRKEDSNYQTQHLIDNYLDKLESKKTKIVRYRLTQNKTKASRFFRDITNKKFNNIDLKKLNNLLNINNGENTKTKTKKIRNSKKNYKRKV